jgi:nucleoside-diphosphate-sugar epimerase
MSETHVAVTGAAGYIGSRVVREIQDAHPEWTVTALDNFYRGKLRAIGDTEIQHVDIRDRDRLEAALEGADVVLHLAAISGIEDCEEDADLAYEVNVQGTENVAWFCRKTGAALSFPFSMAVIGDPQLFPITVDHPRDPMNWYGRTKLLSERSIETLAEGSFPAHQFLISNLYGHHTVDGQRISKSVVINFFVNRARNGEPLTVYEPGTQSRNFVHVVDVARSLVRSTERLLEQLQAGETGSEAYEIATDEDPSVMEMAELVADIAADQGHERPDVELVENPRGNETLVSDFDVDWSSAHEQLGWEPTQTVEETVEELLAE